MPTRSAHVLVFESARAETCFSDEKWRCSDAYGEGATQRWTGNAPRTKQLTGRQAADSSELGVREMFFLEVQQAS